MERRDKRKNKIIEILTTHINNNLKQYAIISVIFLIGIIIGVIFINNIDAKNEENVKEYLNVFTKSLQTDYEIDKGELLKSSITSNLILGISIWFIGCTVIGIPIIYLIILVKGFSLGYTLSSVVLTFGIWKGIIFILSSMLTQNIISIPCILALVVSGMRLYKSIMKDKRKENIKLEVLRHTIFSALITGVLIVSSFIEVYISSNLFMLIVKYI